MNEYVAEVESRLKEFPVIDVSHSSFKPENYIGGGQSQLRYIGLRVPQVKAALKQGFSFSSLDLPEQAKVWDVIWSNSNCFEVMSLALEWFNQFRQGKDLLAYWPMLREWSSFIDNWAHSDSLCALYTRIVEEKPAIIYPTLKKWNKSKSPWLRRISMVSLLYYSSQRERFLPVNKIFTLVTPQIKFDHHYVQRGVGWTLRESYNAYPKQTMGYLLDHVQDLSAIAFSAASEKLTTKEKDKLKKMRKKKRNKNLNFSFYFFP